MTQDSIPSFNIHFCLATHHVTRMISPAMHHGFKPEMVVILTSPEYDQSIQNCSRILIKHGIETKILPVTRNWVLSELNQTIHQFLSSLPEDKSIVLNVSGDNNAMVVAAQSYFSEKQFPMFFLDEKNDSIILYENSAITTSTPEVIPVQDNLRLSDFLLSFGIKVETDTLVKEKTDNNQLQIFNYLISNFSLVSKVLGKFNYYSAMAQNADLTAILKNDDKNDDNLNALIKQFGLSGMCQLSKNLLSFPSEEARFFCNGGWLENYVLHLIQELAQELPIQDMAKGLEVQLPNHSLNELDVVFIANNRFYLIECKTRSYKKQFRHDAVNMMYKLDTLKDYAGVRAKAMLISFKDIPQNSMNRAQDYDIQVVSYQHLQELKDILRIWIK